MTLEKMRELKDISYASLICGVLLDTLCTIPSNQYESAGEVAGKILGDFSKESGIDLYYLAQAELSVQ